MPYIHIDRKTETFMERYANSTGLSLETSLKEALKEWYELLGEPVEIHAVKNQLSKPVTKAPSRPKSMRVRSKTRPIAKAQQVHIITDADRLRARGLGIQLD